MIHIRVCQTGDRGRWDAYVERTRNTTFFQLFDWRGILESVFGLQTHYLCAERDGDIAGILPLYGVRSLLFGRYLSSLPGGVYAEDTEVAEALAESAKRLTREYNADYLIIRDGRQSWALPGTVLNADHCTLVASVGPELDQAWSHIRSEERRVIKQASSRGVAVTTDPGRLDEFYRFYLEATRAQGTPPYSLRFFRAVREMFPTCTTLQLVTFDGDAIAAGMIVPFKTTVLCTWAAIPPKHHRLRPSHLLLWKAIEYANENGFAEVDFGRSQRNSGTYTFKRKWGAEPRPLYQYYFLNRLTRPPLVGHERAEDGRYRRAASLWCRLPLAITETVGAQVRRRVPFG